MKRLVVILLLAFAGAAQAAQINTQFEDGGGGWYKTGHEQTNGEGQRQCLWTNGGYYYEWRGC